jgi:hypothetical protein
MELSEMSLRDHFKNAAANLRDDGIEKVAKRIALAVRDLHRGLWVIPHIQISSNLSCDASEPEARKHDVLQRFQRPIDFKSHRL